MAKSKIAAISGAVTASLGGLGTVIAGFGLCPCVLAPTFSFFGIATFIIGFLSKNRFYLLAAGVVLIAASIILNYHKKTCKVHNKNK